MPSNHVLHCCFSSIISFRSLAQAPGGQRGNDGAAGVGAGAGEEEDEEGAALRHLGEGVTGAAQKRREMRAAMEAGLEDGGEETLFQKGRQHNTAPA